ncbi:hypothetical protein NQZ79_g733 [Umbelopsis isabellina]|nr:hypothetical protein NQZ79_g733 [Umbelopsis isabellina]
MKNFQPFSLAVSRYALVKLFEPFGKITLMDFLFHWTGPKRGQPRGYCFLEYSTKQVRKDHVYEALKAIDKMNNRMIKGRPLTVSFAIAAPTHEDSRKGQTSSSSNRPNLLTVMKTQKMANASLDHVLTTQNFIFPSGKHGREDTGHREEARRVERGQRKFFDSQQ